MKQMLERSDHYDCGLPFEIQGTQVKPAPQTLSPTLAESPEEDARRLHPYTVTENERILVAEFPLQRQHDNERAHQQGGSHKAKPLSEWKDMPGAGANRDLRVSNSRKAGRARRAASAPAANASSTREKSFQSMWCTS